jgi:hypothetical protein
MKLLAIIDVVAGVATEEIRTEIPNELKGSWTLFAAGALREAYATSSPTRVVFILEAPDAAHAAIDLGKLPLIQAGLLRYELIELLPFTNWSVLFAR